MGSCLSCPQKDSTPDDHHSKFKVINVDDDGRELGSGVMELTDSELLLHTHRRDDVRWPYLCLRRYGYDSNLFSFESGRRCQTGQGIFAFKCSRAEEIFNMLQEVMQSHSISVVEEPVMEPHTPAALGYSVPSVVPNGLTRLPSVGEAPSHPSSRHPSVASTRLPSLGEESTHPLLLTEDTTRDRDRDSLPVPHTHTYVNTTGLMDDQPSPAPPVSPLESPVSPLCPPTPPDPPPRLRPDPPNPPPLPQTQTPPEPTVLLEPQGARFVLGPTPVQSRRQMEKEKKTKVPELQETNGHLEPEPATPLLSNGSHSTHTHTHTQPGSTHTHTQPGSTHTHTQPGSTHTHPATPSQQNVNNSAQRRTALLDYENLPALPPVWESRKPSGEEEELNLRPPSLNGYNHSSTHHSSTHHSSTHHSSTQGPLTHHSTHGHHGHHGPLTGSYPLSAAAIESSHNYVNTENVSVAPLSACRPDTARRRTEGPTIFNFDFRRTSGLTEPPKTLNYIEVEMDQYSSSKGASDGSNPHTPRTPSSPLPPTTPTRRTELYALIDIERTNAMSSLQRHRPRDDGTARKTRHNSTELPTKSTA